MPKKQELPFEDISGKIRDENPSVNYEWDVIDGGKPGCMSDFVEIGMGKLSIVNLVTEKSTGNKYVAKKIYYDDDVKFAEREYKLMMGISERQKKGAFEPKPFFTHAGFVKIHEAFILRKYMVIIMENADGPTILEYVSTKNSYTENDAASLVKQILEALAYCHSYNVVHLDIRPSNIRVQKGGVVKIVDYNSARELANKKAGAVVDVIGDTEFCGPEMLNFDSVTPTSDIWGVGVLTYILLTGISPFFHEEEAKVLQAVVKVEYDDPETDITSEAKDFLSKKSTRVFRKAPEISEDNPTSRFSAVQALGHAWLDDGLASKRKGKDLGGVQSDIEDTNKRLMAEEEEDYVCCSGELRSFAEDEYESPEESSEEEA